MHFFEVGKFAHATISAVDPSAASISIKHFCLLRRILTHSVWPRKAA